MIKRRELLAGSAAFIMTGNTSGARLREGCINRQSHLFSEELLARGSATLKFSGAGV